MEKLSEEDINKLYTYCALNKNGENIVAKINSFEIEKWKEQYMQCFNESYFSLSSVKSTVRKNIVILIPRIKKVVIIIFLSN